NLVIAQLLTSSQLGNTSQVDQQEAFGIVNEVLECRLNGFSGGIPRPFERADEHFGQRTSRMVIRLRHWNMPQARIINEQPVGQIAFFVDDPDDGIEKGATRVTTRPRACLMREDERSRERLMFLG